MAGRSVAKTDNRGSGGAPVTAGPILSAPPSVFWAVGFLIAAYAVLALTPTAGVSAISRAFAFSPLRFSVAVTQGEGMSAVAATLFTHMFLHASIPHIAFNALWLLAFGAPIARRFQSSSRFWAYFLCCGAAGALMFGLFHWRDATLLVGASGGVTGFLGGLVRFAFRRPPVFAQGPPPRLGLLDPAVLTWSAVIIALNVSVAVFGAGFGVGEADIAWEAHIGGYLFGLIAFPLFDRRR